MRAQTGAICLENTHNVAGGALLPQHAVDELCAAARVLDIPTHLDGARLPNASAATGLSMSDLAAGFDTVMIDFAKGLGAPAGAIVAGAGDTISAARGVRKLLGGAIHQPGVLAAACLYGLDHLFPQLALDHRNAVRLARALSQLPAVCVENPAPATNIVIVRLGGALDPASTCDLLRTRGVLVNAMDDGRLRFVTHGDVSEGDIDTACELLRETLGTSGR
jgi:threonine aldolase